MGLWAGSVNQQVSPPLEATQRNDETAVSLGNRQCVTKWWVCAFAVRAVTVWAPPPVMSGIFLTWWNLSWLPTTLSKPGIMHFEDQDLSQDSSVGNAVGVPRRLEP